jgi:hypothetical protein
VATVAPLSLEASARAPWSPRPLIMDMVHNNPGEKPLETAFDDPARLREYGFNAQVMMDYIEGAATFQSLDPTLIPPDSEAGKWAAARNQRIEKQIEAAHAQGIQALAWMQFLVFPKAVVERYHDEIFDGEGRIDISKPRTQELLRVQLREIFARFPGLDGLVIRTGEIYLHDLPHHIAIYKEGKSGGTTHASTAIINGPASHIELITILREEVAEKLDKTAIYRTWSFGRDNFHESPKYYLEVTDAIEPHRNLIFSIKYSRGDFHRLQEFNPTLGIGKHQQIVEVQAQMEAYGKGAHPYYTGKGVIDGFEEYDWLMKPGPMRGLRDFVQSPLYAGVWTWARGGGWAGPFLKNELWCDLHVYVISQFAREPSRSEEEIMADFAKKIGLKGDDIDKFRKIQLLSADAVLRGQLTTLRVPLNIWWARDQYIEAVDLSAFLKSGKMEDALQEKAEAVEMWKQIEALARELNVPDKPTQDFIRSSATYGRIKYAIFEQAWTILLLGREGDDTGMFDKERLAKAIRTYDQLWAEWRELAKTEPTLSTLATDRGFKGGPGIGVAVDKYRKIVGVEKPSATR